VPIRGIFSTRIAAPRSPGRLNAKSSHKLDVRKVLQGLPALHVRSTVIDGEVIVQGGQGRSDFHALQAELRRKKPSGLVFRAFDLLHLNGEAA
jgi:hypothetical protein